MATRTTTYPVNEVLGFCDGTKQMLETYKPDMIAAGVDPTALIAQLGPLHTTLNTENIKQEGIKTELRTQTEVVEAAKGDAYTTASRGIDMVISAFGRTSQQAKEAVALRKSVRPEPPTPPTPPTP